RRPVFAEGMCHSEAVAGEDAREGVADLLSQLGRVTGMVERPHDVSPESRQEDSMHLRVAEDVELLMPLGNFADARELVLCLAESTHPDQRVNPHVRHGQQWADAEEVSAGSRIVSDECRRLRVAFLRRAEMPEQRV